jgi:hypothetical protein
MGIKYLWDTNIAIYYLQQQFPTFVEKLIDALLAENQPAISVITEIELMCWKNPTENDEILLNGFLGDSIIIELDKLIKIQTATTSKTIKLNSPMPSLPQLHWLIATHLSPETSKILQILKA